MNEFLTWRRPQESISGNVGPLAVNLNVPAGFAAKLYDFAVYSQMAGNSRYGYNLVRTAVPAVEGLRTWTNDNEVLDDGSVIAAFQARDNLTTTGRNIQFFPQTEHLWPLDYQVVSQMHISGFNQVAQFVGFRLRYQLVPASKLKVAAILFWQNEGVKRA